MMPQHTELRGALGVGIEYELQARIGIFVLRQPRSRLTYSLSTRSIQASTSTVWMSARWALLR